MNTRKHHRARLQAARPDITPAIKALDRDKATGLPMPFNVFEDRHGEPDFGRTATSFTASLAKARECSVCGEPLREFWFRIGKPPGRQRFTSKTGIRKIHPFASAAAPPQVLTVAPVHLECLRFAATACPVMHAQGTQFAVRVTRYDVIEGAAPGDAATYRVQEPTHIARLVPRPVEGFRK